MDGQKAQNPTLLIIGGVLLFLLIVIFVSQMLISERQQPPPTPAPKYIYTDNGVRQESPQAEPAGFQSAPVLNRKSGSVPFTILEHDWSGNTLTIVTQNVEQQSLTLTRFAAGGGTIPYGVDYMRTVVGAGEKRTITASMSSECNPGSSYELNVTFDYEKAGVRYQEIGGKPIIGKCS